MSALITTLGTLAIFRGLTQSVGGGRNTIISGFDWAIARPLSISVAALVFLAVAVVVSVVLGRTVFDRSIYATGANENAARLVGIRTKRAVFAAFVLSGAFIGLAGLLSASQLGSTSGATGLGLELAVVTAVILGGTSLKGGTGTVLGTVLGLLHRGGAEQRARADEHQLDLAAGGHGHAPDPGRLLRPAPAAPDARPVRAWPR